MKYQGTAGYKDGIDHAKFWEWCREMTRLGHEVYISEYNAPDDFYCVVETEHYTTMTKSNKDKRVEKLFKFLDLY